MSLASSLPLQERISYYRKQAEETLVRARLAPDQDTHMGLLNLAAGWHNLAIELEKLLDLPAAGAVEAALSKTPPQN